MPEQRVCGCGNCALCLPATAAVAVNNDAGVNATAVTVEGNPIADESTTASLQTQPSRISDDTQPHDEEMDDADAMAKKKPRNWTRRLDTTKFVNKFVNKFACNSIARERGIGGSGLDSLFWISHSRLRLTSQQGAPPVLVDKVMTLVIWGFRRRAARLRLKAFVIIYWKSHVKICFRLAFI